MSKDFLWKVGIDEVGRGPLAGPLCIGMVGTRKGADLEWSKGIRDSKQLTERERHEWITIIKKKKQTGDIIFKSTFISNGVIDSKGIRYALFTAVARLLKEFSEETTVLLDGSLYAPERFHNQLTIIKGDEKEPLIALASIVAKVRRDEYMKRQCRRYPEYGFSCHKGYGTHEHRAAIKRYGLSPLHRQTFCTKIPTV